MERRPWASRVTLEIFRDGNLFKYAYAAGYFGLLGPEVIDWLRFSGGMERGPSERLAGTRRPHLMSGTRAEMEVGAKHIRSVHDRLGEARTRAQGGPTEVKITDQDCVEVLRMMFHAGVREWELRHRREMNLGDRRAYFADLMTLGRAMGVQELPSNVAEMDAGRALARSPGSKWLDDLFERKLGRRTYGLVKAVQAELLPPDLAAELGRQRRAPVRVALALYARFGSSRFEQAAMDAAERHRSRRLALRES